MINLTRLFSTACLLALGACGGGGGSSGSTPPGTTLPVAADITLQLSATSLSNTGTGTVTATVTAVDSNRNTVSGIPVRLSVDNDATIAVSGNTTSAAGTVTGTIGIGASRANRIVLVTATSGTIVRQASLQIVGARITATALPAVLLPSTAGSVQYRVVDGNGNPMGGMAINVTRAGVTTSGNTGTNGDYEYTYTAPATAGTLAIRAASAGVEVTTDVLVQSGPSTVPPVTTGSVRSASVSANPSVVPVNASGSTTNRAEVRALFVGNNNAPVQNVRVRFDLAGDTNSIGGTFTAGTSIIYSDPNGVATTAYVAGNRFSPTDGVTVRACWDYADFGVGTCPNQATATVTVISDALSVTIGTDELIVIEDLVYVKRFIVQVNDSSGLAKPDVQVSPLLDLPFYHKGNYIRTGSAWVQIVAASQCGNEDLNRNGVLEMYSNGGLEDANGNGQLEPRKADVVVAFEGSSRTNASGQVILRVVYPRNIASWVTFDLTVAAAGVSGTEGRASYRAVLPVPQSAIAAEGSPAFARSPYGQQASPTVVLTLPDNSASATLCTNPN